MSQPPIKIQIGKAEPRDTKTEGVTGENEDLTSKATEDPDVRQRQIYIRAENQGKYTNLALVRKWSVPKLPNMIGVTICVNNVNVHMRPSKETPTAYEFDFRVLRPKWADLLGMTPGECDLVALEELLTVNQLTAMQHYKLVSLKKLRGAVFTKDLDLVFHFDYKPRTVVPARVEVVEEYYVSDIHKQTYTK